MTNKSFACSVGYAPERPADKQVFLVCGAWDDLDQVWLHGFDDIWDAWAFCVAHGIGDPTELTPERFRQWTNRPPEKTEKQPEQMSLL